MRIIIADDHTIVRKGLQQISATQPGWYVAAEAANAGEVFDALRGAQYDLLVLDVTLGDSSGVEILNQIRAQGISLPVLIMSMHPEEHYALRCVRAGANGYIQKDSPIAEIVNAITTVTSGSKYLSPRMAGILADEATRGTNPPHERLSDREFEVFRLIAHGRGPSEIARALNLSVKTVSTYRSRIMEKTGFRSNADIVAYAIRGSLI